MGRHVFETTRHAGGLSGNRVFLDLAEDITDWQPPEYTSVAYFCAAVTSLAKCKKDPSYAEKINVTNTVTLAKKLAAQGVFVVFLSTNLVFDGSTPFQNADHPTCPNTEYGKMKVAAEQQLLELGSSVSIVRFTKVLGPNMPLFKEWKATLKKGGAIHPFSDMVMSPVPLRFAAEVLISIAEKRLFGITQVSGTEDLTYEQAARYITKLMGADQGLVQAIRTGESGLSIEPPPRHTTLDISRLGKEFGLKPPDIWQTIKDACGQ
jgi:dTDP-4-dehydrorhamnose reductase